MRMNIEKKFWGKFPQYSLLLSPKIIMVLVMANGDDALIVGALYTSAKKHKRLASIIIEAAEMIMAERAKSN